MTATASGQALERVTAALLKVGSRNAGGNEWTCPAHDDGSASLTVKYGSVVGRVVMKCGAGCETKVVLKRLGLKWADLHDPDAAVTDRQVGKPVFYVYTDEDGEPLFRVTRKVYESGRKEFLQHGADGVGGWRTGEQPMKGVRRVLWRLPTVVKAVRKGKPIHLAEGEKDVQALVAAGEVATCHPMGAGKWQDSYTSSLRGAAEIVVWADRDGPGYRCAHKRLTSLIAAGIPARALLPVPDFDGADVYDHLAAGHSPQDGKPVTLDELLALAEEAQPGKAAKAEKAPTQAEFVIQFVRSRYRLGVTPEGEAFAMANAGMRLPVVFPRTGGGFKDQVGLEMYEATGRIVGDTNMQLAMKTLHAEARRTEVASVLHLRCASTPERVVIDLAQPRTTRCVVITADGWTVQEEPPAGVLFRRTRSMLPLPTPVRGDGAGWEALADLLGWRVDQRWFLLARGWLVAAPLHFIPRPLLNLVGAPGSGKTSRGKALVDVLDPKTELGSSFGKNLDDDRVKALGSYLVAYDNVSAVSDAQSDHVCRMVSGESATKRKHYEDTEEVAMVYRRTGVITSITVLKWQPDALERLIQLPLTRIADDAYKSETRLKARFTEVHPFILGDLCDDVARMLRRLPGLLTEDTRKGQRMKDYHLAQTALGSKYAKAFATANDEVMVEAAENDPWVVSVRDWLRDLDGHTFTGTPTEVLTVFTDYAWDSPVANGEPSVHSRWPKTPRAMGDLLLRSATPLRAVGVSYEMKRSNGSRKWTLTWAGRRG